MQFVIIHGTFGSRDGNWFPWLDHELTKLNQRVIRPQMPVDVFENVERSMTNTGSYLHPKQNLSSWLNTFQQDILPQLQTNEVVFIGHSLAPAFLLNAIENFDLSVDCAIFVAPFIQNLDNPIFDTINSDFYSKPFDFEKITKKISYSYSLYSTTDPYVPTDAAHFFAEKTHSSLIEVKNAGHMGSMLKEFPLVLELCKTRIGFNL